jgi:hypothetical protein
MRRLVRKVIDMKKMLFGILLILLIAACSPAEPQSTTTQVPPKDTIAPPTTTPLPPTPDVTADWPEYVNTELGYAFKYPAGCSLGPLAADCGEIPPEERSAECLCSLETRRSSSEDVVLLQSLLGNAEEGFTLATFQVLHYDTPEFNPPEGEELSSWLTSQHFVLPEDMPDEPNMVIDGLPAVRVYNHDFRQEFSEEIFVISKGRLITIRIVYVDVEEHRELYENILTTLRFID